MKNQIGPGYTMVPNKLVDAIITYQCTGMKLEILMFLIRHTFGYHRESVAATAVNIADRICRNRIKTSVALRELIQSSVVIEVIKERGKRSFSINMNTVDWRPRPLPELLEMSDENLNGEIPGTQETVSRTGNRETSQMETSLSQPGKNEPARMGNSSIPSRETTPSTAYIDGKNENLSPKENIKENNKRNIYMYDITLIPKTLSEMPGFKRAFNDWCIYRQQIEKPLTGIIIDVQMRKLLLYNSEGFNVISIIENSISAGWPDLYRPGSRQESPAKQVEYKSAKVIKNESY
ncbi:MAG: replication protein [Syntrophothermus sp.]